MAFILAQNAGFHGDAARAADEYRRATGVIAEFEPTGLADLETRGLAGSAAAGRMALGMVYAARGLDAPACDAFAGAATAAPELSVPRFFEAACSLRLGEGDRAQRVLEKALETAPEFRAAHVLMGRVLVGQDRKAAALEHFEIAQSIRPSANGALYVGSLAEQLGDTPRAEAAYARVVEMVPESFIGYNQLAWLLASTGGDPERAERLSRRAMALAPEDPDVIDTAGWTLFLRGEAGAARELLEKAHALAGGTDAGILLHLAEATAGTGENARALELLGPLAEQDTEQGAQARALIERLAR